MFVHQHLSCVVCRAIVSKPQPLANRIILPAQYRWQNHQTTPIFPEIHSYNPPRPAISPLLSTMASPTASIGTPCARDISIRATTPHEACSFSCSICLEQLTTTKSTTVAGPDPDSEPAATIIKCGHVFGRSCLTRWMRDSNPCPICRVEFFVMPESVGEDNSDEDGIPYFGGTVFRSRAHVG